jgi:hypothetical protein
MTEALGLSAAVLGLAARDQVGTNQPGLSATGRHSEARADRLATRCLLPWPL